jgi:hypothetical protein
VNHFRNHLELTRKDLLVKNMKRMKKQLERADALEEAAKYSFLPTSFVLPAEYGAWCGVPSARARPLRRAPCTGHRAHIMLPRAPRIVR